MVSVYKSLRAKKDLTGIFRYYSREAGLSVARRFSKQANMSFEHLADMPHMGTRYDSHRPNTANLRFFPITGFENYLVFYRPVKNGIEIIRVLHSARDVGEILAPTN